jgi:hypothetical protein
VRRRRRPCRGDRGRHRILAYRNLGRFRVILHRMAWRPAPNEVTRSAGPCSVAWPRCSRSRRPTSCRPRRSRPGRSSCSGLQRRRGAAGDRAVRRRGRDRRGRGAADLAARSRRSAACRRRRGLAADPVARAHPDGRPSGAAGLRRHRGSAPEVVGAIRAELRDAPEGVAAYVTGPGGLRRRPRRGVRRDRRHPAAGHGRGRPGHPAGRLPQPGPAAPGAAVADRRAVGGGRRRLPHGAAPAGSRSTGRRRASSSSW